MTLPRPVTKTGAVRALPLVLILVGCPSVDFESDTVVHEDGSVERTSHLEASDDDRLELRSAYAVLDGGAWESRTDRRTADDGELIETHTDTYSVTARYPARAAISSDHVRVGRPEGRALRNEIELDVGSYFFVRTFDYREVYRDDVGTKLVHALVEELYPQWVDNMAVGLADGLDGVLVDEARRVVVELSEPGVEKFLAGEYIPGLFSDESDDATVDALWDALAPEDETARDVVKTVFNESFEDWDEREDVKEAVDGVYEDWVFGSYSFRQTLTMPGTIVDTNAGAVTGSVLTWEFEQDAIFMQDYELSARSRVVYPGRIVASIVVAALGFFAGAWSGRRRARPTLDSDAERAAEDEREHDR